MVKIETEEMSLGEYYKFRKMIIPNNEDPNKKGIKVVYPKGVTTWQPFENNTGGFVNKDIVLINIIEGLQLRLKNNESSLACDLNNALNEIIQKHNLEITPTDNLATNHQQIMQHHLDLNDVFQEQIKLNEKIKPTLYTDIQDQDIRREWFLRFELAMRQESSEAIDSLNWKWWKKTQDDWDNIKIELVDILHFWVSMCTIAGMSASDVIDLYFKKNKLNHHRQDNGYKEGLYNKMQDGVEDNRKLF